MESVLYLEDTVDWTNHDAGCFVEITFTVNAYAFIDDIDVVAGRNSVDRAFRLTSCTIGALFSNSMCHDGMFFCCKSSVTRGDHQSFHALESLTVIGLT